MLVAGIITGVALLVIIWLLTPWNPFHGAGAEAGLAGVLLIFVSAIVAAVGGWIIVAEWLF